MPGLAVTAQMEAAIAKVFKLRFATRRAVETRFENAEKNAAKFIAQLLKERGWGVDKVKKHQDFSNKYCPHRTLDKGWASFVNMVKDYLNELNNPVQSTQSSSISVGDKVKVKTTATNYATGQSMASFVKGSTYEVTRS